VKLNLGCGDDIREGYTNVDFRKTHPSVVEVDLSRFPWPFQDGSADEILMLDFLEHFPYSQTERILLECYRVLTPNGHVTVQVPDARHLTKALTQSDWYLCNQCGTKMYGLDTGEWVHKCPGCGQTDDEISYAAMKRLYGGQDYPGNFHYTCFTENSLDQILYKCGFSTPRREEKDHQFKNWNMKRTYSRGEIQW
jgi:SAM-dependent methyltransferase